MLLHELADVSTEVAGSAARLRKVELIADCLHRAEPDEAALVVTYLSGELRQRRTGVGYAAFRDLPGPADEASLTLAEVDAVFEALSEIAGAGSQSRRRELLSALMARATATEQRLIVGLVGGELRQGALDGVMTDALIRATGLEAAAVRRAVMVSGSLARVAPALLTDGAAALDRFRLQVGSPIRPMLAASATEIGEALDRLRSAAVEWKLDGVRVQAHRQDDRVWLFTRTLEDVTDRLPEVAEAVAALPVDSIVLDGEVLALDDRDRPLPFQVTSSRVGSRTDVARARAQTPVTPFFFDLLHLDGDDLLGAAGERRWQRLNATVPERLRVPRIVTDQPATAQEFFTDAVARGHEGVVAKALDATYDAGRRGAGWIKVKPRHTLDLVVLAAEWGHGRRTGKLSNLHLGAREAETGEFVMLGKTFKGLTDQMLGWQTERLLALAEPDQPDRWVVRVRPELVVEIAFDGVQHSSRYPGGMALRFARVLRHRPDKPAGEADTLTAVRDIHTRSDPGHTGSGHG